MGKTKTAHAKGVYAENLAVLLLRVKGYSILNQRFRCAHGEVDIIARRGDWLIFVEVKARPETEKALYAVVEKSRRRIIRAAQMYLAQNPDLYELKTRFDVITASPKQFPRHHENMWQNDLNEL